MGGAALPDRQHANAKSRTSASRPQSPTAQRRDGATRGGPSSSQGQSWQKTQHQQHQQQQQRQPSARAQLGAQLFRALVNNVNAPYVARRPEAGEVATTDGGAQHQHGNRAANIAVGGVTEPSHSLPSFSPAQSMAFIDGLGARAGPSPNPKAPSEGAAKRDQKGENQQKHQQRERAVADRPSGADSAADPAGGNSISGIPTAAMGRSSGLVGFLKGRRSEVMLLRSLRRKALKDSQSKATERLAAELRETVNKLVELSEREMRLEGGGGRRGGGGGGVADPQKQRYVLNQTFQQVIGRLTRDHFAAADVDVLVTLVRLCGRTSFAEHTNSALFSACQVLQCSAANLSHRDVADIVLSLGASAALAEGGGSASVGQLYLDWFLEYLIGAERMGPDVLGPDPSATGAGGGGGAMVVATPEGGRQVGGSDARLWQLLPPNRAHWLLRLMVDQPDTFVYGHCQAFTLKLLTAVTRTMEPCAERYHALRAIGAGSGGALSAEQQQQQATLLAELKMAQMRNAAAMERGPISEQMLSTICAAIIHYKVETVEALDFFIAAAPLCLERAPFMRGSDVATMLLAFVTVGYRDADFFAALGDEVARQSEFLSDLSAGRVLAALKKCGLAHDNLSRALESSRRMRQLGSRDLRENTTDV